MAFTIYIPTYSVQGDGEDYVKHLWEKQQEFAFVPVKLEMPIETFKWSVEKVVG